MQSLLKTIISVSHLMSVRRQSSPVSSLPDFKDKGLMENNLDIKNESEFRYCLRVNKYQVAIVVNLFNLAVQLINPLFQTNE